MRSVTVIIPVYNAFDVTLDCIRSVVSTIPGNVRVCVIDDASPSGDLREFLPKEILAHPLVRVLRNENNLGFVGTCNRGMLIETDDDVILLNSDTLVTGRWVQKLQNAAYSGPKIGTVTPLTNNGTICSVPRFLENNGFPSGYSLESFGKLVEDLSDFSYVEAPTCVGFCTYIRRDMLDEVGVFDPIFRQGYGEENDLSLRAKQKGYTNIIDDATYVYHRGNMSFKEMREALSKANTEILNSRYPSYEHAVASFCTSNPLAKVHDRIFHALLPGWLSSRKRSVLHLVHNGPFVARHHALGGTERYVQAIIRNDKESAHFSLCPGHGCLYLTCHTDNGDWTLVLSPDLLPSVLHPSLFGIVHLHHCLGFNRSVLCDALQRHGRYMVSVHDYHLVCGRLWLVQPDGSVCDGGVCGGCCGDSDVAGIERREIARRIFDGAGRIVVFSESTRRIISELFGHYPSLQKHSHGIDIAERQPVAIPSKPSLRVPLRVLCVGTFTPHKGSELIQQCAVTIDQVEDVPVEWHFLGPGAEDVTGLRSWGEYTLQNLRDKVAKVEPHVALLAPQCQETYSLTLDEIVWTGVPVICSPFGALPERINRWRVGYVFDNTIEGIQEVLRGIARDWSTHTEMFDSARKAPIRSVTEEVSDCVLMYEQDFRVAPPNTEVFVAVMRRYAGLPTRNSLKYATRQATQKIARRLKKLIAESESLPG